MIDAFDAAAGQISTDTEGEEKIARSYQVRASPTQQLHFYGACWTFACPYVLLRPVSCVLSTAVRSS